MYFGSNKCSLGVDKKKYPYLYLAIYIYIYIFHHLEPKNNQTALDIHVLFHSVSEGQSVLCQCPPPQIDMFSSDSYSHSKLWPTLHFLQSQTPHHHPWHHLLVCCWNPVKWDHCEKFIPQLLKSALIPKPGALEVPLSSNNLHLQTNLHWTAICWDWVNDGLKSMEPADLYRQKELERDRSGWWYDICIKLFIFLPRNNGLQVQ